jgi:hypothetical protein
MITNSDKSFRLFVISLGVCLLSVGCIHSAPRQNAGSATGDPKITVYGKSSDYKGLLSPERYVAIATQYARKQNVKLQEDTNAYRGIMVQFEKDKAAFVVVILKTTGKYPQYPLYTVRMDVDGRVLSGTFGYADA